MSIRSRADLERSLHELGLRCAVEEWESLAVAVPQPGERGFEDDDLRARAIALAREHGFSHLAVELRDAQREAPNQPGAALPRD